jgi:hypothetical protein
LSTEWILGALRATLVVGIWREEGGGNFTWEETAGEDEACAAVAQGIHATVAQVILLHAYAVKAQDKA